MAFAFGVLFQTQSLTRLELFPVKPREAVNVPQVLVDDLEYLFSPELSDIIQECAELVRLVLRDIGAGL